MLLINIDQYLMIYLNVLYTLKCSVIIISCLILEHDVNGFFEIHPDKF